MWTAPAIAAIVGVLLGLLLLLAGLGGVINPASRMRAIREFAQSSGMQLLGGMMAFVMGAAVVTIVPLSDNLFGICITVLGWLMLVKGALLLVWGDGYMGMARGINDRTLPVFSWVMTILGAILFITALQNLRSEAGAEAEAMVAPSPEADQSVAAPAQ